jgi:hypothetical protein
MTIFIMHSFIILVITYDIIKYTNMYIYYTLFMYL